MKVSAPSRNRPPRRGPPHGSEAPLSPSHETDWNTERYARDARFVPALGRAAVEWLDPRPGERVLDLGCGDGTLTRDLAASGAEVLGIDASASQIAPAFATLLPGTRRACFFNDVARRLEPDLFDRDRGLWWVDYARLRFEAVKS